MARPANAASRSTPSPAVGQAPPPHLVSPHDSLLLTDFYELAMLQAYAESGLAGTAVFEFFVRKLPSSRGFLMAAGLEQALHFLETARFTDAEREALRRMGDFPSAFIDELAGFRFTGDVDAMAEGTVFFPDEPVLRVIAPLPQAQLIESRIVNLLHFQTIVASKAARMVLAGPEKPIVDFGLRRAHGAEAGLFAARASYIAGFAGTATLEASLRFGIPAFGTMAHSFIQVHDDESLAFEDFARSRPEGIVLLIDTYDTERGAARAARMAKRLARDNIHVRAVRIDSGDLGEHARRVRAILDAHGLQNVTIFASGGLDEEKIAELTRIGAPIDGYGVGTSLTTSSDAPALDCAYKIQEYDGIPRRKRSEGKATWPGRKQIWRRHAADGGFVDDVLGLMAEAGNGDPLLQPAMRSGRRLAAPPSLGTIRAHAADQLRRLPAALRQLQPMIYPVSVSDALRKLAEECDRRVEANVAGDSARD